MSRVPLLLPFPPFPLPKRWSINANRHLSSTLSWVKPLSASIATRSFSSLACAVRAELASKMISRGSVWDPRHSTSSNFFAVRGDLAALDLKTSDSSISVPIAKHFSGGDIIHVRYCIPTTDVLSVDDDDDLRRVARPSREPDSMWCARQQVCYI